MTPLQAQSQMITALATIIERDTGLPVQRYETHISVVLVTSQLAWKFKKPLQLPYVDYSTLEKRRHYCDEEIRLNRRLAPALYRGVVAVAGSAHAPRFVVLSVPESEAGEILDYAVEMRSFTQESLWSARAAGNLLSARESAALAEHLARYHAQASIAPKDSDWGSPNAVIRAADASFAELRILLADIASAESAPSQQLAQLIAWEARQQPQLAVALEQRRAAGMIRECHGDLHCGNLLTLDGAVQAFDCIEFSDSLRWIDVMNDIAFVTMDLGCRGYAGLAADFLSRYLEASGDHEGVRVLRHYVVQRALIRAKVLLTRAAQADGPAATDAIRLRNEGLAYLAHGQRLAFPAPRVLCITHGLAGSGKSTFARLVVQVLDAVQLRSDVERKRLHGVPVLDRPDETGAAMLYASDATAATYAHLATVAATIVRAGWSVIVDAAFLSREQRKRFRELAQGLNVAFVIFDFIAEIDILRERLRLRQAEGQDASDAGAEVLALQLQQQQPLSVEESACAIPVDMRESLDLRELQDLFRGTTLEKFAGLCAR